MTLGLGVAGSLTLLAFLTSGGVDLRPNTWVEVVLTTIACTLSAAVVLIGARGRAWGVVTLVLFGALAALTFASIAWSVQPANSWVEASRTLSYLGVFAAAMALARLAPARWTALVGAVAVAATVLAGYALLVKVFPATLDASNSLGRLRAPFDYYNATGLIAALGLPCCLWAGARREGSRILRALVCPGIAILVAVLVLSYGRGALAAAIIGLGCWFAVVPLRLRAALVLAVGLVGGSATSAWALATHSLSHDYVALHARVTAGHTFGLFLILLLAALTLVGFAWQFATDRVVLPAAARRRIGVALVTCVALVPVGVVVGFTLSSRGLGGEVSHVWSALTNSKATVGNSPGRLAELNNSRPRYWSEGLKVGDHALLGGVGAGGFTTAHTRYTTDPRHVGHAHSYVIETFADFGLIGIALNLALLIAWAIAASRPLRAPPGPSAWTPERAGMLTLGTVVLIFGLHSLLDWTWFIPGTAVPALLCAGWLAGRGPLASPLGRRRLVASPAAGAVVIALAAVAVLAAWVIWQPLRSADADSSAISAMLHGDARAALSDARSAAAIDPVSVDPLWEQSAIYSGLGDPVAARRELVKAVSLQPDNPATWEQLGTYDLYQQRQPGAALVTLEHARALDRTSASLAALVAQAKAKLAGG